MNGDDFELLIREMLYNKGLEVYWSGKGPDGGKDLLCIEKYNSFFKTSNKRWLIQCKHNAHSNNSVGVNELGNIHNSCIQHNATGYLLVCSTYPSSSTVNTLEGIEKNSNITTAFWDYRTLERQLLTPQSWSLINRFMPVSAKKLGWQISKIDSDLWYVNYKSNIFYISLRIGSNCDNYLDDISDRIDELTNLKIPESHFLRLRAVYFDAKHTTYILYLDYLIPENEKMNFRSSDEIINFCNDRIIEGVYYQIDLAVYTYSRFSDHFDIDHQDYYSQNFSDFKTGSERYPKNSLPLIRKDNPFSFTEELTNTEYEKFVYAFSKLPYIKILKCTNAQVEKIGLFQDSFSWENTIVATDFSLDNFFSVEIRFECFNFKQLSGLLSLFPQSVTQHFTLDNNFIFLPDKGYESDEDKIYTLKIRIHPAISISKLQFRKHMNQYLNELTGCINHYLKAIEL